MKHEVQICEKESRKSNKKVIVKLKIKLFVADEHGGNVGTGTRLLWRRARSDLRRRRLRATVARTR